MYICFGYVRACVFDICTHHIRAILPISNIFFVLGYGFKTKLSVFYLFLVTWMRILLCLNGCIYLGCVTCIIPLGSLKYYPIPSQQVAQMKLNSHYRQTSNISHTLVCNKIADHSLGFNILHKDKCKAKRETFMFWDYVRLILEIWWCFANITDLNWHGGNLHRVSQNADRYTIHCLPFVIGYL